MALYMYAYIKLNSLKISFQEETILKLTVKAMFQSEILARFPNGCSVHDTILYSPGDNCVSFTYV